MTNCWLIAEFCKNLFQQKFLRTIKLLTASKDSWSMSGDFIYCHHEDPSITLYEPEESKFTVPLTLTNSEFYPPRQYLARSLDQDVQETRRKIEDWEEGNAKLQAARSNR